MEMLGGGEGGVEMLGGGEGRGGDAVEGKEGGAARSPRMLGGKRSGGLVGVFAH